MTRRDALARHPLAIAGALITTASAVVFIALVIAMLAGLLDNPYAGLVVFVAIPAVFVLGLLLIPLGMRLQRRKLQRDPNARRRLAGSRLPSRRASAGPRSSSRRSPPSTSSSSCWPATAACTGWSRRRFCGQACHTPMQPQFTAWQSAAHARVACVSCHIGEGARGFVHAKLSGVRQLVHVATNSLSAADPAGRRDAAGRPGADLRAAATSPGASIGDRHPRDSRVCRRRSEHRDDDRASDARGRRRPSSAPRDPLARRSRRSRRVRRDGRGAPDDPVRQESPTRRDR